MYYVYRITNIEENKHYYGYRNSKDNKPEDDLGILYFSSSLNKDFLYEQKTHKDRYKYKVIFKTSFKEKAQDFEIRLHRKFNVGAHNSFYNGATQTHRALIGTKATAMKGAITRKTTILANGLTIEQDAVKRSVETGKSNIIDGKNSYQRSAEKIYGSKDEEYRINKSKKSAETMKQERTYVETGEKHKIYQNEIMQSGLTRAQETGMKVSETRKQMYKDELLPDITGSNNPVAAHIIIYNNEDEKIYECNGNFQTICEEKNLPSSFLKRSYQSSDKLVFQKTKGMSQVFFEKNKEFEGWYAIKL